MSIDRILQLKLIADVNDINSKMTSVTAQTSKVGAAFKTLTSFVGPVAITAAIVALEKLGEGISNGMEDARKFDDAVSGLQSSLAPLGVAADEATRLAESAAAAGSALGFADDDQVVRGLQAFAEQTQSVTEAQALLAAAMDLSRLKGITLEEAVTKVQAIYKGSARTLAEFGIAGVSGMAAVNAALGDNSQAAETWATTTQGQYATTAAALDDAFQTAGAAINTALDTVILPAISQIIPLIGQLWAEWQPKLAAVAEGVGLAIGKMIEIWNKLQPTVQAFFDFVSPILANFQVMVETVFGVISGTLDAIIALLNGDFTGAWNALTGVVQTVLDGIMAGVGNMLAFLSGIVGTIGTIAGNIGQAIWDGVTGALAGLANAIVSPIRSGLNTIVDAWNAFGIHIPEIVLFDALGRRDTIGPINFEFPDLPRLAKGGIVNSPTLALIGEAGPEAVVPLGRGGGMGANYTINVNVAPGGDLVEAGRQMVRAIQQYERRGGRSWRAT